MSMIQHGRQFAEVRAQGVEPLSEAELRKHVPALFARAPHASRSDRYAYIPSIEVLRGLTAEGFNPVAVRQSRTRDDSRRGFTKHMVRFRRHGALERRVGDAVPEVVLLNSHDGSSSYRLMAGLFRLVCLNGLVVAAGRLAEVTVSHVGSIETVMPKVIEGAYTVLAESEKALEAPRKWSKINLSDAQRLDFAEAAHKLRFADSEGDVDTPILPTQLLVVRRPADTGSDLWRTFNVVQENVMRGGLRAIRPGNGHRYTSRTINGVDQDVRINRGLWSLAESYAAKKAA